MKKLIYIISLILFGCPKDKPIKNIRVKPLKKEVKTIVVKKDTVFNNLDSIVDFGNVQIYNYTIFGFPVYASNKTLNYGTILINGTSPIDNAKAFSVASASEKVNDGNTIYIDSIKAVKPNNVVFFGQNIKDGLIKDIIIDGALQDRIAPKAGTVILKFDNAWSDSIDLRKLEFGNVVIKNSYLGTDLKTIDGEDASLFLVGTWLSSGVNNYYFKSFRSDLPLRINAEPDDPQKSTGNHVFDYCYLEKKRSYSYHYLYNSYIKKLVLDDTNTTHIIDCKIDTLYHRNTEIKITNSVIKYKEKLK